MTKAEHELLSALQYIRDSTRYSTYEIKEFAGIVVNNYLAGDYDETNKED